MGEELNRGGLGVERNEDLCDCRCGDGAGAEDRLAGSRAAAGGRRWSQAAPGGASPKAQHPWVPGASQRGRGRGQGQKPRPMGQAGQARLLLPAWRYADRARLSPAFSGDASRLRLGMKSQRVCGQQRTLPVVSGRAAPSRKAPSSVSPSVVSSKLHQCKRPFALCLSVTSV